MSAVPAPCNRIAVIPGVSGVDTATVTTGLALAMASMSRRDVLLLDVDGTTAPPAGTTLPARLGLRRAGPGAVWPVAPRLAIQGGARAADLARDWSHHCGVLVVHSGPGPDPALLEAILDAVQAVLIVAPDTSAGAASVLGALAWLREQRRGMLADAAIVALASSGGDHGVAGRHTDTLEQQCWSVRRLPDDLVGLAPGILDPVELSDRTQQALLDLAERVTAVFDPLTAPSSGLPGLHGA